MSDVRTVWLPEHDEILIQAIKDNKQGYQGVAEQVGRSVNACYKRMYFLRYGAYDKRGTKEHKPKIGVAMDQGRIWYNEQTIADWYKKNNDRAVTAMREAGFGPDAYRGRNG